MRFPNAHKGVKQIFTAEMLSLLCVIVATIISGMMTSGADESTMGVIAIVGLVTGIVAIIAFILKLLGVINARKDEGNFSYALWAILAGIVCSLVATAFSGNTTVSSICTAVNDICSALVTYYVITGILSLAKQLGNKDMIAKGKRARTILITIWVIVIILQLVSAIFGAGNETMNIIMAVLAMCAGILEIVLYIIYLAYLSKARVMLGQ